MTLDLGPVLKDAIREALSELGLELRAHDARASGDADELLTYALAAQLAKVSTETIGHWVRGGALPATGKGKLRRVKRCDVLRVLDRMRLKPGNAASESIEGCVSKIARSIR